MTVFTQTAPHELYLHHQKTLQAAIEALRAREFYAQYPEIPSGKVYGEDSNEKQHAVFTAQLNHPFQGLLQTSDTQITGAENSPFTREALGVAYPASKNIESYIQQAHAAWGAWKYADTETRAGILVESLERIKQRFFEIAFATQHTTGQSFMMSFQASGPHANDRALEAIAMGLEEQTRYPKQAHWEKPMGKFNVVLKKHYQCQPKGISLTIGCSTFPVWNTVPGLYASLITGNPVIVKPHPAAIYPIAIVITELQHILKDNGFDPHLVQLAVDTPENQITKLLCEHPSVKMIDFTGGNAFGNYVESLPGKITFTEKAGINSVILDSCTDLNGTLQNLAFSVSLYSGQMCTCPQNFYIPENGILVNGERVSYEEVVKGFIKAIEDLTHHEKMGPGTLGAIQNETTYQRVATVAQSGVKVLLPSKSIPHPEFPNARTATPLVLEVPLANREMIEQELFGPIVLIVPTKDTQQSVALASELSSIHGALTCAAYSTDPATQAYIARNLAESFTPVTFNLTGPIWVNQSAGFSDFHVSGGNPAGNASFTNPEFVIKRFVLIGTRIA
jgi:phenylacetic acid degradation protein paaN